MSHIEEECINNDMFSVFINHLEKTDMSYRNPVPFSVQGLNYQYIIDEKNYKICSLTMQKVHMKNKISFLTKHVKYCRGELIKAKNHQVELMKEQKSPTIASKQLKNG